MLDEGHSAKEVAKAIQAKRLDLAQARAQLRRHLSVGAHPTAHPLSRPAHRDRRFFARLLAERAATTDATTDPLAADTTATPVSGISWRVLSCIRLSTGMPPDAYMYVHGLVASLALDFMTPDQFERTLERDPATAAYVEGFAPTDPASMPRETRATR